MRVQHKKEASMILAVAFAIIAGTALTGCGKQFQGAMGPAGPKGDKGDQGYGAGVAAEAIAGLCGATDGVRLTTFQDKNNNGLRESDETVNAVTTVCNGSNGSNGTNGANGTSSTLSFSTTALACGAPGGYTVTVTNGAVQTSFPICNGAQGNQGIQGVAGLNGSNGTTVTPVKFCNSDTSTYPEYGLYVGSDLYAVYWGSTPASSAAQAFLTKLVPGSYMSTGGINCAFTINANYQVQ